MSTLKYFGGLFLLAVSVAHANAPLPVGPYLGIDYLQMVGGNGTTACFGLGCGGEFSGVITLAGQGPSALPNAVTTNFWCVDLQEDFSYGTAGYVDVVPVPYVAGNPNVRYSNVGTGSGAPSWTTDLGSSFATAQQRYNLAAWLVSQYPGVSGNLANPQIDNSFSDSSAIQQAIWVVMSNTSSGPGFSPEFSISGPGYSAANTFGDAVRVSELIDLAKLHYGSTLGQWAVVSWDADPNTGALAGANHQTFLVEMSGVPEPSFYGFLALGIAGMYVAVRRRKTA